MPTTAMRQRNQEIAARLAAGASLREVGVTFGISGERVRQIAVAAGGPHKRRHRAPLWPATRTARLRKLWGRMSAAEIGLKLGVSKHAVIGKARRLGLSSPSINRKVKVRHTAPSRALPGARSVAPSRGQSVD
jgi:DNA-binding CsgD family transcriptional regulator